MSSGTKRSLPSQIGESSHEDEPATKTPRFNVPQSDPFSFSHPAGHLQNPASATTDDVSSERTFAIATSRSHQRQRLHQQTGSASLNGIAAAVAGAHRSTRPLPPENASYDTTRGDSVDDTQRNGAATAPQPQPPKEPPPRLTLHGRVRPTAVTNNEKIIRVPAGGEKASELRLKWIGAFKKADKSRYRYTTIAKDQSRLLVLKPGKDNEEVNATLLVIDDKNLGSDDYPYEALSYHWGEGADENTIIIQDDFKAKPIKSLADTTIGVMTAEGILARRLYVRPNLYEALKSLRSPDGKVPLWVDALCINQKNEEEKTDQIMKMNLIYRKAANVCIWLGSGDNISFQAMMFIKDVINQEEHAKLLSDTSDIPKWTSLFQLLKWSWFSRRWVIQELAFAKEATVHCGPQTVHWNDFKDAIGIFHRYFQSLRPKLQDKKLSSTPISDLEPLGARLLVEVSGNLLRRKPDGSHESTMDMETLVSLLTGFDTSDPRDTINSVRNISSELNYTSNDKVSRNPSGIPQVPAPDYTKDLYEVYQGFIEWVVTAKKSLDILCRHWAIPEREKIGILAPPLHQGLSFYPPGSLPSTRDPMAGAKQYSKAANLGTASWDSPEKAVTKLPRGGSP